jgi:hypothetical protein
MAKTAKKKAFKITPRKSRRTRGDVVKQIAEATESEDRKGARSVRYALRS